MENQTETKITQQDVMAENMTSSDYGFTCSVIKDRRNDLETKRKGLKEKTAISNEKIVVASIATCIGVGSIFLEGIIVKNCVGGMLGIGIGGSLATGAIFSSLGILSGYTLKKALSKKHPITNKRLYNDPLLYVSLGLCLLYLGGQIAIAVRAATGLVGEAAYIATSFVLLLILICCVEIAVGYLYIEEVSDEIIDFVKLQACEWNPMQTSPALGNITDRIKNRRSKFKKQHYGIHFSGNSIDSDSILHCQIFLQVLACLSRPVPGTEKPEVTS